MKILGKSETGYLVDMPESDPQAIFGIQYGWGKEGIALLKELGVPMTASYGNDVPNLIGAEVPITTRFRRVTDIERNHRELQNTGATLRKLADLLDQLGNAVIVPATTA